MMKPAGRLNLPAWIAEEDTVRVMDALLKHDGAALFVGGCVRDTLVNRKVYDIDIATSETPEDVIARLEAAKIKYVTPGLDHGTVTAVTENRPFEITTLRRDVETDGRRAEVEYTDDWTEDAARRDFTFNAIYCNLQGELFDPFGGIEDLRLGRVRFVGDARQRITEDYLRILRYFRMFAHFGRDAPDEEALDACVELADNVPNLSGERIRNEALRLLEADRAAIVWRVMTDSGVTAHFLPEATRCDVLERLMKLEERLSSKTFVLRRLAGVLDGGLDLAKDVAHRLRLSNIETDILAQMAALHDKIDLDGMDDRAVRRLVHQHGNDMLRTLMLLRAAVTGEEGKLEDLYQKATACRLPRFPLRGRDVLDLGISEGPKVGEAMQAMEDWWIEQDFQPKRRAMLDELAARYGAAPADASAK